MSIWDGVGAVLGKVTNWIPNRRESLLNRKTELQDELSKLADKPKFDARTYSRLSDELHKVQQKLDTLGS
jgi:hypothetical protein